MPGDIWGITTGTYFGYQSSIRYEMFLGRGFSLLAAGLGSLHVVSCEFLGSRRGILRGRNLRVRLRRGWGRCVVRAAGLRLASLRPLHPMAGRYGWAHHGRLDSVERDCWHETGQCCKYGRHHWSHHFAEEHYGTGVDLRCDGSNQYDDCDWAGQAGYMYLSSLLC